jgi:hypothetical protein
LIKLTQGIQSLFPKNTVNSTLHGRMARKNRKKRSNMRKIGGYFPIYTIEYFIFAYISEIDTIRKQKNVFHFLSFFTLKKHDINRSNKSSSRMSHP